MPLSSWFRSDLEIEAQAERLELRRILGMPDDSGRVEALRRLALEVGASTINAHTGYGDATLPELTHNIHLALQTKAMVAAVRTSSNYFIATVVLVLITLLSTVAAFVAAARSNC